MSNMNFSESPWQWPNVCAPAVHEGMARLRTLRNSTVDDPPAGWKIAANDPGMRARWKLPHCLVGHVERTAVRQGNSTYQLSNFSCAAVEPELCISIERDLLGEESEFDVLSALGSVRLAAELIDINGRVDDVAAVIGGNIFHRGLALSRYCVDHQLFDPATMLIASRNNRPVWRLPAMALLPAFATIAQFVAKALRASGERLRAGQFILSGVLTPLPIWVQPGDQVDISLGEENRLRLGFQGDRKC